MSLQCSIEALGEEALTRPSGTLSHAKRHGRGR